jgi:uncharacterized protein (DUF924 family)
MRAADVLEFWFGPSSGPRAVREFWFRKSDETDAAIRARFGTALEDALAGRLDHWSDSTAGTRALILLLDQFTRNAYRDTPRAFAGDAAALSHARRLVANGDDLRCDPIERWFIYMPFEHSEALADQDESVRLFGQLATAGLAAPLEWAERHRDVIRRFGRFPHRNDILGRISTPEEIGFLLQPGARF